MNIGESSAVQYVIRALQDRTPNPDAVEALVSLARRARDTLGAGEALSADAARELLAAAAPAAPDPDATYTKGSLAVRGDELLCKGSDGRWRHLVATPYGPVLDEGRALAGSQVIYVRPEPGDSR